MFCRTCAASWSQAAWTRNKKARAIIDDIESAGPGSVPVSHSLLAAACSGISGSKAAKVTALEYDLVVIGSGPAGQKCAVAAAKAGKRVAAIDRTGMIGGVSVHTGTIPGKTVREAIFQLLKLLKDRFTYCF